MQQFHPPIHKHRHEDTKAQLGGIGSDPPHSVSLDSFCTSKEWHQRSLARSFGTVKKQKNPKKHKGFLCAGRKTAALLLLNILTSSIERRQMKFTLITSVCAVKHPGPRGQALPRDICHETESRLRWLAREEIRKVQLTEETLEQRSTFHQATLMFFVTRDSTRRPGSLRPEPRAALPFVATV